MKEFIICPTCHKNCITEKIVYPPSEAPKFVTLEDHVKNQVEYYKKYPDHSGCYSGDASMMLFSESYKKPIQLVYTCYNCGFTRVVDL